MGASRGRRRRLRRSWLQRLVILGNCMLIVASLVAAFGLQVAWAKVRTVHRVALGSTLAGGGLDSSPESGPQNYLIAGVDSDAGLAPDEALQNRPPGLRSDVIMVLRVDPANAQAQLLSIPRDLLVTIAGGGKDKINSAIGISQEALLDTIKNNLGIPINHFVQVDFAGFEAMVSAVGGIQVNFPAVSRDRKSFLSPIGPGCVALDPKQALALVRSRDFEVQAKGKWQFDPLSDLGRIDRDQELIRVIIQRAISDGASDPRVFQGLVTAALKAVTIDDRLSVRQILDLGAKFRNFTGDKLVTYRLPVTDVTFEGMDALLLTAGAAQPTLDLFRNVSTPPNAPIYTLVEIHNGSPDSGVGGSVANDLRDRGFTLPDDFVKDAVEGFSVPKTTINYSPGDEAKARLLASYLKGPVAFKREIVFIADVDLLIGADWQGVLPTPRSDADVAALPGVPPVTSTTSTTTTGPTLSGTPAALPTTLPPSQTVGIDRAVFVPTGC